MTDAELFGRRIFEADDVNLLLANMALDLIVMLVLVGLLYYRQTRDRDHTFMMVTLNLVVFLVAFFMNSVEVGVGFGFGLFALFGIVRYRTESVPVREMSYLFVTIALGLTNAIGATVLSWSEVLVANVSIIIIIGTLSQLFWRKSVVVRDVVYDQIDNIRPDRRRELFEDLWDRVGLHATDVDLVSVNLLNETAVLRVSCDTSRSSRRSRADLDLDGDLRYDVVPQMATNGSAPMQRSGGTPSAGVQGAAVPGGGVPGGGVRNATVPSRVVPSGAGAPANGSARAHNGAPANDTAPPHNPAHPNSTVQVNGGVTRHVGPPTNGGMPRGDAPNGGAHAAGHDTPAQRALGGYPPPRPPQGGSGPLQGS